MQITKEVTDEVQRFVDLLAAGSVVPGESASKAAIEEAKDEAILS